ncbi:MAG: zinc ribbon domain-containing protein [Kiritimatiellae bacterium]|nr:zinc ribbon domain-containing protein [Kiritimatiellia bacterium]
MPLFEYRCKSCGRDFEALVTPSRPASCPSCGSTSLEKRLSVFAPATSSPSCPAAPSCPGHSHSCGCSSCCPHSH